ncbi:hypothetical protein C8R43DRAFT_1107045 [Mycena crocata]|nr:hypothetical protein C8R43DRAFT_1107045 [Mycena crocata]
MAFRCRTVANASITNRYQSQGDCGTILHSTSPEYLVELIINMTKVFTMSTSQELYSTNIAQFIFVSMKHRRSPSEQASASKTRAVLIKITRGFKIQIVAFEKHNFAISASQELDIVFHSSDVALRINQANTLGRESWFNVQSPHSTSSLTASIEVFQYLEFGKRCSRRRRVSEPTQFEQRIGFNYIRRHESDDEVCEDVREVNGVDAHMNGTVEPGIVVQEDPGLGVICRRSIMGA